MSVITTLELHSPNTLTAAPYTFAQVFKEGDVPAGVGVVGTGLTFQCKPRNYWPDGSLKIAMVSGTTDMAAGIPTTVTLSHGSVTDGSAITTAAIKAANLTLDYTAEAFGTATFTGTDWDSPVLSIVSGPVMSSWLFRKPFSADPHLVAWVELRCYAGGKIQYIPWVENGFLKVPSPSNKVATFTFSANEELLFTQALDFKSHTRTPLISGVSLSYWNVAAPLVTPFHNQEYLCATELFPTYIRRSAINGANLTTTYVPFQRSNFRTTMSAGGGDGSLCLITGHDSLYVNADFHPDLYGSILRNGFSGGRYSTHWRDELTHRPARISQHPNLCIAPAAAAYNAVGVSSKNQYAPGGAGGANATWATSHHPSIGYISYLISGWYYFLEEQQFVSSCIALLQIDTTRLFGKGIIESRAGANQARGAGWGIRTLGQVACASPDGDVMAGEFRTQLEENINFYHTKYIAQPNNPFGFVHDVTDYYGGSGKLELASWQQDFVTMSWGFMKAIKPPMSTESADKLTAFFAWKAKSVIGRLGGTAPDEWPYGYAANYTFSVGPADSLDFAAGTGPWYPSFGAAFEASLGIPNPGTIVNLQDGNYPEDTSYWANLTPAIAYAVRHGVTGAAAAWARLTTDANWLAQENAFAAGPAYGIRPAIAMAAAVERVRGSKTRVSSQDIIPGCTVVGQRGLGTLGTNIPADSIMHSFVGVVGADHEWRCVPTAPVTGLSRLYEDGTYDYEGTTATITFNLYEDGEDLGTRSSQLTGNVDPVAPSPPTDVVATAGNGSVSVAFVPGSSGGSPITSFTVTASTGQTASGSASPIVVAVPNGTATSFTVTATNAVGTSAPSDSSASVTPAAPATVPDAPTNVVASPGNGSASVSFTAPSDGGSAITSYTVTASSGQTTAGASSPINITVPSGAAVNFTVKATNSVGSGPASEPSNTVTPQAPTQGIPITISATWVEGADIFIANALVDITDPNFTPSAARTVTVHPGANAFSAGPFWTMTDAKKPRAIKDPDAKIDIPFDWAPWLADIRDFIGSVEFIVDGGLTVEGSGYTATTATVFVSGGTISQQTRASITCRVTTGSNPSRVEDRTVYLDIEAR